MRTRVQITLIINTEAKIAQLPTKQKDQNRTSAKNWKFVH